MFKKGYLIEMVLFGISKIIEYFQKVEQEQAYNFSKLNEIPIFLYDNENCFMDAVNFVKL